MEELQTVLLGKIPVNIITTTVLQEMLKNIYLNLLEGYEIVMISGLHGLAWHYKYVQAALITNLQGFMVVLSIPIKDIYRQYELHRLHVFPTEILNGKFVKCDIEKEYLALHALQHTYLLLSANELSKCPGREPKIFAVNHPIYGPEDNT
jgi:hypothetical protein